MYRQTKRTDGQKDELFNVSPFNFFLKQGRWATVGPKEIVCKLLTGWHSCEPENTLTRICAVKYVGLPCPLSFHGSLHTLQSEAGTEGELAVGVAWHVA
jgi:hypothetical protein